MDELARSPDLQPSAERRHHPRERLSLSIRVSGADRSGRRFTERSQLIDISPGGCAFELSKPIEPGAHVHLIFETLDLFCQEVGEVDGALARVVWAESNPFEETWRVGAELVRRP